MTTTISGDTGCDKVVDESITQADLAPNVVGNGPCFSAYQSVLQSVTSAVVKVQLQTKEFDTNAFFDTTNSRFQPTVPGYYNIRRQVSGAFTGSTYCAAYLYKNGVVIASGLTSSASGNYIGLPVEKLIYLNGTTDYVELWVTSNTTANSTVGSDKTFLQGFLARVA